MRISAQKKWLFGSFLVAAPNPHAARRAYDFLIERYDYSGPPTGIVLLDTGEVVRWTRFADF